MRGEWNEDADAARQGCVDEGLGAPGDQRALL